MKRMKKTCALFITLCLCLTLFNLPTYGRTVNKPVYYRLDESSNRFQIKNSASYTAPNPNISNGYKTFYVDGRENRLRIISCNLNEAESNSMPYTGLKRIKTIANGQTSTTVDENFTSTAVVTSKMRTTESNYNFGVDLSYTKQYVTLNLLGEKVIKDLLSVGFSSKFSFSNSYTTNTTTSNVKSLTKTYTKSYTIPNLPSFKDCNSADFYTFTNYYVYDVTAEILIPNATSNPRFGYTDYTYTSSIKRPYSSRKRCQYCGKEYVADMLVPSLDPEFEEEYDFRDIAHVDFADGSSGHCTREQWRSILNDEDNIYKKYSSCVNTTVTFKYYWPVVEGVVVPWTIGGPNDLVLNKPIHMVPRGMEQTIYDGNRYYKMIVDESPLIDPYYNIHFPGEQIGDPVLPGTTQTIAFNRSLSTTSKTEKTVVKKKSRSFSLVAKFKNWLSISGGYTKNKTKIDSSSTTVTNTHTLKETNKYVLPTSFMNAGYDGTRIHLTKDSMIYAVKGRIIPYSASTGNLDPNDDSILTYDQEFQYPRIYATPFDVR